MQKAVAVGCGVLLCLLAIRVEAQSPADPPTAEPVTAPTPALTPIEQFSLEDLLDENIATGEVGSFGFRLDQLKTKIFLHGYATVDYVAQGASHQFDLHYFNLLVGANIADLVFPEVQVEVEHARDFAVRFAQVDGKLRDWLVVRAGLFLVPFGVYNEFLYPEYISKLPRSPLVLLNANIIPVAWNDVGVQLRGRVPFGTGHEFNYAAYLSNGLEQVDSAPHDGVPAERGGIRQMRGNFLDANHGNKAFGGRLGLSLWETTVTVGASAYRGIYTAEGGRFLSILGADLLLSFKKFYFRVEAAMALQEITDPADSARLVILQKQGIYAVAAYEVTRWFEPALGFDRQVLGGRVSDNKSRTTLCLNFRPLERAQLVLRASYTFSLSDDPGQPRDDLFMLQGSVGF